MKRRGRARRVAKWAGLVACALIVGVWVVSACRGIYSPLWHWRNDQIGVGALHGCCVLVYVTDLPPYLRWMQWSLEDGSRSWPSQWVPSMDWSHYEFVQVTVKVPLWMPLLLFGGPTALLWWRDRRRVQTGRCATCDYDLAGLAAGAPCPECGEPV